VLGKCLSGPPGMSVNAPAGEVLQVGELRSRVLAGSDRVVGRQPGDTKKRRGWLGSALPFAE
jgi:hypothetical protein